MDFRGVILLKWESGENNNILWISSLRSKRVSHKNVHLRGDQKPFFMKRLLPFWPATQKGGSR